jgi:hypothetical protein
MKSKSIRVLVASGVLAAVAAISNSASATTLYDDLSAVSQGSDQASAIGPLYDSFSTGSSAFDLSNINLLINGVNTDGHTFDVAVYANNTITNPNTPGGKIFDVGNISDSVLSASLTVVGLNNFAPHTLAANTRYWVGISSSDSSVVWSWTYDTTGIGVANEYFYNSYGESHATPNEFGPYQMSVTGDTLTATPLPSTWTMLIAGFLGLGFFAYCRSKKKFAANATA